MLTVEEVKKDKKKPLALTLDIKPLEVIIKTGPEGNIYKRVEEPKMNIPTMAKVISVKDYMSAKNNQKNITLKLTRNFKKLTKKY